MDLHFLDRAGEREQLTGLVSRREGGFGVLYGRRRCGKSRLLQEVLPPGRSIYYAGDDRESTIQRAALGVEIGRRLPGFDDVRYPDWDALLSRVFREAQPASVLALDEFPSLVSAAPDLPSVLQKHLDARPRRGLHVIIAGSSQRLMQGLVLDRTAPLFGRATAIVPVGPLPAGWIQKALPLRAAAAAVEAYAVWGGIPRYWELAADYRNTADAVASLVLSPLAILHDEPSRLLLDDMRDTAQAASILSLVARGSHRLSEIAGRLEKPATSLGRPVQRLLELGLVDREVPFGSTVRDTKRTLYKVSDPFLRFWFRHVEPARSRLAARQVEEVAADIARSFGQHVAGVWEDLARASAAHLQAFGHQWRRASRWWGPGLDRRPMEIDVVAESDDRKALLLGEVCWSGGETSASLAAELRRKAEVFPLARGRRIHLALWLARPARIRDVHTFTPHDVLRVLR
jgi:hypothetical protein